MNATENRTLGTIGWTSARITELESENFALREKLARLAGVMQGVADGFGNILPNLEGSLLTFEKRELNRLVNRLRTAHDPR